MNNPTNKTTMSRAAMLARRRELDALRIINHAAFWNNLDGKKRPDYHAPAATVPPEIAEAVRVVDLAVSLPGVRMQRRDLLIARETVTAPRNALVVVTREIDGKADVDLGLWTKGGQRVITLTLTDGREQLFIREEMTYLGLVIGYIRREDRRATHPPVHVFKTGGA